MNYKYLLGVAVGLTISWATGAIAYYIKGCSTVWSFIIFELIVSVIMFIIALSLKKRWEEK